MQSSTVKPHSSPAFRAHLTSFGSLIFLALAAAQAARAQDTYQARARAPHEVFESMRSSQNVTRQAAEQSAPGQVGDVVAQSGTVVSRTSSSSAAPILRGLTGYQVLLMADELRLNDSLMRAGGNALLNLIDLESIERIEIVRGPASVLYGSDALGGVVRVHSLRPGAGLGEDRPATASLYARAASAARAARVQASVAAVRKPFAVRLSGGYDHAGTLQRGGGLGEQAFTGYRAGSFASALEWEISPHQHVSLTHQSGHLWDAPRSDVSTLEDRQTTVRLDREAALLRYVAELPEQRARVSLYAGMTLRTEQRERLRPLRAEQERDRVLGYQLGGGLQLTPWRDAQLEVGTAATLERIGSGTERQNPQSGELTRGRGRYLDGSRYDSVALYGLLTQPITSGVTALGGARATWVHARAPIDPLFDAAAQRRLDRGFVGFSGALGVRAELSSELAWLLSGLSGFRAPNLEDFQTFGGGARGFTIPNPELDAERAWTLETGLQWRSSWLQASLFVFGTWLRGLIVRKPDQFQGMTEVEGEPVLSRANASHGTLVGAESELRAQLGQGVYAAAALSGVWGETMRPDAEGHPVKEPASKLPGPVGLLRLGFERQELPFWAQAVLSAQLPQARLSEADKLDVRLCADGPEACDEVAGYADVSLRAGARLGKQLQLTAALENLFDAGYRSYASGMYAPGRNLVVGLRGTL